MPLKKLFDLSAAIKHCEMLVETHVRKQCVGSDTVSNWDELDVKEYMQRRGLGRNGHVDHVDDELWNRIQVFELAIRLCDEAGATEEVEANSP